MDKRSIETKERYLFRIEPSLIKRVDTVAEVRFGGNRSLVVRNAIKRYVEELERQVIADREGHAA